jgi:hypothetical protein
MLYSKKLTDSALRIFDFAIDLICRNVDESRRRVGYQRLEAEAFFHLGTELGIGFGDHTLLVSHQVSAIAQPDACVHWFLGGRCAEFY